MYLCINCNAPNVERDGDKFKCPKCKYEWDVAHEQANAAYLASQGRKPAASLEEMSADPKTAVDPLLQELGLVPTESGEPDDPEAPADDTGASDSQDEQPEVPETPGEGTPDLEEKWRSTGEEDDEPEDDTAEGEEVDEAIVAALLHKALNEKTVAELEVLADEVNLDMGSGNKPDKIQVLIDSQRVALVDGEVVALYDADGDLIDVE